MKNLCLALAFMLVGTFVFANNSVETELNVEETIEITNSLELASFDYSSFENYTIVKSSDTALGCLLTITVEYTDGSSDTFYIAVYGVSCAELFAML